MFLPHSGRVQGAMDGHIITAGPVQLSISAAQNSAIPQPRVLHSQRTIALDTQQHSTATGAAIWLAPSNSDQVLQILGPALSNDAHMAVLTTDAKPASAA